MGEGFLSAACHYSEVYDSASDLLGFQSTVYCTVKKIMHVHPGIESGPYALSSLVIFFILSRLLWGQLSRLGWLEAGMSEAVRQLAEGISSVR